VMRQFIRNAGIEISESEPDIIRQSRRPEILIEDLLEAREKMVRELEYDSDWSELEEMIQDIEKGNQ